MRTKEKIEQLKQQRAVADREFIGAVRIIVETQGTRAHTKVADIAQALLKRDCVVTGCCDMLEVLEGE